MKTYRRANGLQTGRGFNSPHKTVLFDAREFVSGRFTGIARFLKGLIRAWSASKISDRILLAVIDPNAVPGDMLEQHGVECATLSASFFKSEKMLSDLTRHQVALFISPYPKLPLFGTHCKAIHTVHDVLDLTHPAYCKRRRVFFDRLRLKLALNRADMTWYVSRWSQTQTEALTGFTGKNPRVRYHGIDDRFAAKADRRPEDMLRKYGLSPGYILTIGNGLPHKNLGILLEISHAVGRNLVFAGVSENQQRYWTERYPTANARWIGFVAEEDLPMVIQNAFCVAQPSTVEGYGYPPMEAMACGVPAVVSNIPVLVETTGGNALRADAHDPASWQRAFKALEEADVYQRQVRQGLDWIVPFQKPTSWEKHIADIHEMISER